MSYDNLNEEYELIIQNKLFAKSKRKTLFDGFKKNKVINEVLDKPTVFEIYDLIKSHIISYINGVVKAGKESVVFWGKSDDDQDLALKIYLISTSNFKKRAGYIEGDPRFSRIKKGTKNLVYLWAQKEFRNLSQCYEKGIPVVKPIHVSKNILVMEFIGKNGSPAKTLLESQVDMDDYESAISLIRMLYKDAKLVHGDFSEYNIFKTEKGLILFDLGSAVDLKHPNSKDFLERDINNITRFFVKRGLTVENPSDVMQKVTK
ncbi:MAG TPA: serine protein kinase RIO [Nitrosopumilaceae archaeon]|nr:serine protein kinase RIO [Nitrosopumilaceae archaeon]